MKQIQSAILALEGHLSSEEFSTLCLAIYEMRSALPIPPQMKVICSNVKTRANLTSPGAVSKCLERAVHQLFEYGNKDLLSSYQLSWSFERPFPNEFIRVVAIHLWDGSSQSSSQAS